MYANPAAPLHRSRRPDHRRLGRPRRQPGGRARRVLAAACAVLTGLAWAVLPAAPASAAPVAFRNPLQANGADPWLTYFNGNYYLATTTWTSQMFMRRSPTLAGLQTATPVLIWQGDNASRCCNFWAPEFRRLSGPNGTRWYFMFTAGPSGTFDNQHLVVLESAGDDPLGPYTFRAEPLGTGWGIDGGYLQVNGQLYLMWSAFSGDQVMLISRMSNPWTVTGPRVIFSRPTLSWERQGGAVNEGPVALQRNGQTFVVYSASFCGTPDYKLGLLRLTGSDPLNAASWTKAPNPVFQRSNANGVYGPGHNGFFTSPDGTESWIVYHANTSTSQGCGTTRSTRAQRFTWNADGTPNFGTPASTGTQLAGPAGENGPTPAPAPTGTFTVVNRATGKCLDLNGGSTADGANVFQWACSSGANQRWRFEDAGGGARRVVNVAGGKVLDVASCGTADGADIRQWTWLDNACQRWNVLPTDSGWVQLQNANSGKVADVANCGTADGTDVRQWTWLANTCQQWQLRAA